ncbi:MAG: ATP-binding protein [Tannerellaceae bacterium]|jgi:tetratricopeptide (TPR) repeat protein|nr:ATP-binding protein [Tannerellaceae bacterium]
MDNQKKDFFIGCDGCDEEWPKPARNRYFTGREGIMETVRQYFKESRYVVLTGPGGVGKSQTAKEYAFRHAFEYETVWWVNAETADTLLPSFKSFAGTRKLLSTDNDTSAQIIEAVRDWMNWHDNWLFIFDNADDEASLTPYLPQETAHRRHVLITSRNGNWGTFAVPLPVDVFSEEEAAEFLTRRTGRPRDAFQDSLAEELGYLPLALEQAAAYTKAQAIDGETYLELFRRTKAEWLKRYPGIKRENQILAATCYSSMEAIKHEAAKELLYLCAYFAPDYIDPWWFVDASVYLPPALRKAAENEPDYHDTLMELDRYSLVSNDGVLLSLHRPVQEVVRERLKEEQTVWINYCIQVLHQCRYSDFSTPESRFLFTDLVPHIHSVIAQIDPETQTVEIARLYFFLGYGYSQFAEYDQSLKWYRKALDIQEKVSGASHPDTAITYNNIALVYHGQGEYGQAMEWHRKALEIREKILGISHPDTATTCDNIAEVYRSLGEYNQALKWHRKALEIYEKVLGSSHPDTATTYNNMAVVYYFQGEYEKAMEWYRKALEVYEKVLGASHPDTVTAYNNMAGVYHSQGEYKQALKWYMKTLEIREKVLGVSHPDTATTYNNIAEVHRSLGEYEQALKWHRKALEIKEKVLGASHPDTAIAYNNIALVYHSQGEYGQAMEWHRKALEIREKILGISHPDTATTYNNIAKAYANQGEYAQSLKWYLKALPVFIGKLGMDHPHTKIVINNAKTAYIQSGNPQPFEEWLKEHGGAF